MSIGPVNKALKAQLAQVKPIGYDVNLPDIKALLSFKVVNDYLFVFLSEQPVQIYKINTNILVKSGSFECRKTMNCSAGTPPN